MGAERAGMSRALWSTPKEAVTSRKHTGYVNAEIVILARIIRVSTAPFKRIYGSVVPATIISSYDAPR